MTYIFMIAGKGSRLQPLTLACPKSMYMLDENTTVFQRMVNLIRRYDSDQTIGADVMLSFLGDFRFVTMFLRNFKHQSLCFGTDMCAAGENAGNSCR